MSKILIVATGGIRTYKQVELAKELLDQGHEVKCINTRHSFLFLISYLILNPRMSIIYFKTMHLSFFELYEYFKGFMARKTSHVSVARWADIILIAPITCNSLGKIVSGVTDNFPLLVVRAFSRGKKVLLAPSMNPEMWADPATENNIKKLKDTSKYLVIDPVEGVTFGSGEKGNGIIAPNQVIIDAVNRHLK